jgi:hypothetical protein
LNPQGYGTISIVKIISNDIKFDLYSIKDKNLIVDSEMEKPQIKHVEWATFNKIFGGDYIDIEGKYKQKFSGRLKCKGIFISNLPIIKIDSPATVERIILIQTKNEKIPVNKRIPNIEEKILEKERDAISTYFVQILKILKNMNFIFPEIIKINEHGEIVKWDEIDLEERAELLNLLSDPVQLFIEERTQHFSNSSNSFGYEKDGNIPVNEVYEAFINWCKDKNIVPLTKQTFTKRFGFEYPKKRIRIGKNRSYVFCDLILFDDDEEKLGHNSDNGKDAQDKNFDMVDVMSHLLTLKLVDVSENEKDHKDSPSKLGQTKKSFKVFTELDFRYKALCPSLFTEEEFQTEPNIENGTRNNIVDSFHIENNNFKYFKSDEYFPPNYFNDIGVKCLEAFSSGMSNYYCLEIPYDLKNENAYKFSSLFSVKATSITAEEFQKAKEGSIK